MNDIIYVGKHALTKAVTNHVHNTWELIYCTSGNGRLTFQDRVLPYSADSLAIIPPMMIHSNYSDEGFTNYHINMSELNLNVNEPMVICGACNEYLKDVFPAAFYYYSNDTAGRPAILQAYSQVIVATLQSYLTDRNGNETVKQIMDHILKNFPDPNFDLNGYLHSLPFSLEYLKRMFKNETGMTPLQYLTNKRLENAAGVLGMMANSTNISQISHKCGFNDPLYFSKLFKKKYGVSPRNYVPKNTEPSDADSDSVKIFI